MAGFGGKCQITCRWWLSFTSFDLKMRRAHDSHFIRDGHHLRLLEGGKDYFVALMAAVDLARAGRLVIFRKGKPADPEDFRGVYRLGLPSSE